MELSEAVDKATAEVHVWAVKVGKDMKPFDLDMQAIRKLATRAQQIEYSSVIDGLVRKVANACSEKVIHSIDFNVLDNLPIEDPQVEGLIEKYSEVLAEEILDLSYQFFALGYILGDPTWDRQEHSSATYTKAMKATDRGTHQALIARFRGESFLYERFTEKAAHANTYVSELFHRMHVDHCRETVENWARITTGITTYESFQVGLRTRRCLEEDAAFDSIIKDLED